MGIIRLLLTMLVFVAHIGPNVFPMRARLANSSQRFTLVTTRGTPLSIDMVV